MLTMHTVRSEPRRSASVIAASHTRERLLAFGESEHTAGDDAPEARVGGDQLAVREHLERERGALLGRAARESPIPRRHRTQDLGAGVVAHTVGTGLGESGRGIGNVGTERHAVQLERLERPTRADELGRQLASGPPCHRHRLVGRTGEQQHPREDPRGQGAGERVLETVVRLTHVTGRGSGIQTGLGHPDVEEQLGTLRGIVGALEGAAQVRHRSVRVTTLGGRQSRSPEHVGNP